MKIETIMDALISAIVLGKANYYTDQDEYLAEKYYRQYRAFRDRILFDFATRETVIALCQQRLRQKDAEIAEKDAELVELRKMKKWVERPFDDPTEGYEKTNEEWSND